MADAPAKPMFGDCNGEFPGLLDCLLDPLFLIAAESGLIVHCNEAALRWQRCERSALVGQSFRILLTAAERESRSDFLEHTRAHGHVVMEQPFALRCGEAARADLSAALWRRAGGDVIVLVLRDAEQRLAAQRLEVEARQTAARLETLARLSHEINNHLQALLLHEGPEFDEAVRAHIDGIIAVMRRMREKETGAAVEETAFLDEPALAEGPAAPAAGMLVPADKCRVLLADDSESIRQGLGLALRQALPDTEVDLAADGEEALACFRDGHPAVVVLDILMPKKRGDQVFEEIAAFCREAHWEEPAIVFCTGYTPPPRVQAALQPPSRHLCLLKPVQPRDLLAAVAGLVAPTRG